MTPARRTSAVAQRVATVVVGVLVTVPLVLVALLAAAGPAEASTYRYWTYWWGSNPGKATPGWTFAQVGPAGHRVGDTWVLGWRFATSTTTTGSAKPRQSPDFATLCPSLAEPVVGQDRVALVVDYGTAADAPPGQTPPSTSTVRVECLTLSASPQHQTGAQALAAAGVTVRSENGLICGLDGYPVDECAPVIPDPVPTQPPASASDSSAPSGASAPGSPSTAPAAAASRTPVGATTRAATGGPTTSGAPSRTPAQVSATTTSSSARPSSASGSAAATGSSPGPGTSTQEAADATGPVAGGDPTTSTTPSASATDDVLPAAAGAPAAPQSSGSPLGLIVGATVVALVAGSAWWTSRRRGRG